MYHLHIDGLEPACDPHLSRAEVYCADTDELLFTGTPDDAELFADMHGGDLEVVTLQDLTRGFA